MSSPVFLGHPAVFSVIVFTSNEPSISVQTLVIRTCTSEFLQSEYACIGRLAQSASALPSHGRGHRFESCNVHLNICPLVASIARRGLSCGLLVSGHRLTSVVLHGLRRILRRLFEVLISDLQIVFCRNHLAVSDPSHDTVERKLFCQFRLTVLEIAMIRLKSNRLIDLTR